MRKMKDSGIAWIGEIPEEWAITSIGILFSVKAGGDAKPNFYSTEKNEAYPYPVYTNTFDENQVYAYTNTPQFEENSITVTGRGAVGHAIYRDTKFDAIIRLLVLSPKMELDCRYYTYFIDNVVVFFTDNAAIGQLSAQQICPYKVCWLPVSTQRRIAAFLDDKCAHIDAVIEKTRASIDEYKKLKQAIITRAVTKGLRQGRKMKDSGIEWIGFIPMEWTLWKLKYMFHIQKIIAGKEGYTILSITQKGIRVKDIASNEGQVAADYSNYQLVHKGDFAMNHMDLLTGWVDISKYDGVTSPDYRVFTLDNKEANSASYYLYLMQMCYSNKIFYGLGQGVSGFGRWRLQADKFLNFYIPVPPLPEQQEIASYLDAKTAAIDRLIAKKEQLIAEMQSCKKSLIYEVVTGKREVAI